MVLIKTILTVCMFVFALHARAQGEVGRLPFKTYGPAQGIPATLIQTMTQDRDGYIWFGTENGLFRYDGGGTTRWGSKDGLPADWVTSLAPHTNGGVWVGTLKGLVRFYEGRFEPVSLNGKPFLESISSLNTDAAGQLWGASGIGPFRQKGSLECELLKGKPHGSMPYLCISHRTGSAWYSLPPNRLAEFRKDGTWHLWGKEQGLPNVTLFSALGEDGQGRLWAAGERHLCCLDPNRDQFSDRSPWMKGGLPENVQCRRDASGAMWLPTTEGILILRGDTYRQLPYGKDIPVDWATVCLHDREGNTWLSGSALLKVQGRGAITFHQKSQGLPSSMVWSVMRTSTGSLYAGTDSGIAKLEGKT